MPQVVHTIALSEVEVLLASLKSEEVAMAVQRGREFDCLAALTSSCSKGITLTWSVELSAADQKLVVGAPAGLISPALRLVLQQPDSEVGSRSELKPTEYLVEGLLSTNEAEPPAGWSEAS